MKPIRILVDSFADEDALNAQMNNARDIVSRLNPDRFEVSMFVRGRPDPRLVKRQRTRLIQLPERRQTPRILRAFVLGAHDILFYVKASPAAKIYMSWRRLWRDPRVVIGTMESQANLRNEPTVAPENIRLFERTVLRSDFLFSNSSAVRASLEHEYGLPSEVVPTGVDTKFFSPAGDRPANSRVRVLFVGSLRPFKGPQVVVEAASRFPEADFVIVGDGTMASELAEQIRANRLTNVSLAGNRSRSAVRDEYQSAEIFLFPSKWEGSPKVILEAAACGLPVIARSDYQPETVVHEKTGLLGGSDDELLGLLGRLLADPQMRIEMGRAARQHSKQFDWDGISSRWEEIFVRLAPRQPGTVRA